MNDDQERLVDAAGVIHEPAAGAARILSLAGPLTDLCLALGLGNRLVARSGDSGSAAEAAAPGSVVGPSDDPDLDRIRELEPTHALVHLDRTSPPVLAALAERGIEVVAARPREPGDNFALFTLLGRLFSAEDMADTLARRLEAVLARIKMAMLRKRARRVLFVTGRNPDRVLTPTSYAARMLGLARLTVVGPADCPDDEAPLDLGPDLVLGLDAILLDGTRGNFRRADIRAFAETYGTSRDRVHLVEDHPGEWYGARAISAVDDLIDLRRRLSQAWTQT
ncbi:MAG: ABC transporter substrate-binding protein [Rhodothalassiaceae bacterium]